MSLRFSVTYLMKRLTKRYRVEVYVKSSAFYNVVCVECDE